MPSASNKKLLILYVLKVLREYSDESHPMLQEEISQKILSLYGMESERKAIGANIQCLEDFGYDIIRVKNKGVYLGEREFEESEITFLIDAVFSSKIINQKHSIDLSKKLYSFLSVNKRRKFNYVYKADEVSKSNNQQLFFNIDVINEAIESGKKIKFNYKSLNTKSSSPAKEKIVSPFFLLNSQGKYYLVCSIGVDKGLANYKIEKMTDVKVSAESALNIDDFEEYKNGFDKVKYVNEHIYAFSGQSVDARLKLYEDFMVGNINDWFSNAKIFERDGELFADVKANEKALVYWCLQYGNYVELIKPSSTREQIKEILQNMAIRYEN